MSYLMIANEEIKNLRNKNVISDSEIAYKQGDIYIAEDVLSGAKRILDRTLLLSEQSSSKRLLLS